MDLSKIKNWSLISLSGLAACTSTNNKQNISEKPNIILIMADDVAPQHLGCYGGKVPTPNLDLLAQEGMKYTRVYATSAACTPSRYSIMTGQYAGRCQDDGFLSDNPKTKPYKIEWNTPITSKNTTLHNVLRKAGYYTGYIGKFHIGKLDFDKSENNPKIPKINEDLNPNTKEADSLLQIYQTIICDEVKRLTGCDFAASIQWENPETIPIKEVRRHNLEWTTNGVMKFLKQTEKTGKPFFLHLNTTTLHGPNHKYDLETEAKYTPEGILDNPYKYHPERKTIFERLDSLNIPYEDVPEHIKHYHTGIIYMDDQVGAILNKIDEMGIAENTIVIYTADHSTEPGKSSCYEQGLKVPFIVRWPKNIKASTSCDQLISFVDFLPTFASIAGVEIKDDIIIDGKDISPSFKNQEIKNSKYIFSEMGYLRAVSNKKYKYIAMRFPKSKIKKLENGELNSLCHMGNDISGFAGIVAKYQPGYFDADQLYDLENDPYEQNNLAYDEKYKDVLNKMQQVLQKHLDSFEHPFDLSDNSYMNLSSYKESVKKIKEKGITVSWWDRDINYPPKKGEVFYY